MKHTKKMTALLLAAAMILVSGCGSKAAEPSKAPEGKETQAQSQGGGETQDQAQSGASQENPGGRTEPLVLKYGSVGSGRENDSMHYPSKHVMDTIEKETNGMITFEYYPASQLGSESSLLDQVLSDSLDMGIITTNVMSNVWPEFSAFSLPFAFPSLESFWGTVNTDGFIEKTQEIVQKNDMAMLIGYHTSGYRGCQNNKRPIRSAEDFKGLTFRVMAGDIYTDVFGNCLGASTVTVAADELYSALQQGVVDGEDTALNYVLDQKYFEVEKYSTQINAMTGSMAILVSNGTWNKLTDQEKEIFLRAGREAGDVSYEFVKKMAEGFAEQVEEKGVELIRNSDLTKEERDSFLNATQPVWEKYRGEVGEEFYDYFNEVREKAIADLGL